MNMVSAMYNVHPYSSSIACQIKLVLTLPWRGLSPLSLVCAPPPWTINEPGESSVHPYPSSNSVSNETGFRYIQTTQQSNYIPWTRTKLFSWYPWNLNLIKTGEDIFVFWLEVFISVGFSLASYKPEMRKSLSQRNHKWK